MASFWDSIVNALSGRHKGRSVGIDIGTSSIKIVEIEKVDEFAVLKNYGELSLGTRGGVASGQATNLAPDAISAALRDLFRETGIVPRHTLFTIPASASLLSLVELPRVPNAELEGMISNEARKYIPLPLPEVSLDWWILPENKTEKETQISGVAEAKGSEHPMIDVVIAAIHNDVLKKYDAIKKGAGIDAASSHVEIETFSTLRAVVGKDLSSVLVVDMGASVTKLTIIDKGAFRGSHIVSFGGQDVTLGLSKAISVTPEEAESIKMSVGMEGDERGRDVRAVAEVLLAGLTTEITRFVENFEQKYKTKIEHLVFVGGGARLKGAIKTFEDKFGKERVMLGDPLARVDSPAFLKTTIADISPTFASALGVALKGLEE